MSGMMGISSSYVNASEGVGVVLRGGTSRVSWGPKERKVLCEDWVLTLTCVVTSDHWSN